MIEYKNIDLSFGNLELFKNFSFKINKGEKVLFKALSGKGKTTLAKMPLGFTKPTAGEIFIDGVPLGKSNIKQIREKIAYVSQDIELKKKKVSDIFQDIYSYRVNKHLVYDSTRILALFKEFQLDSDILDKDLGLLSGGQRQRLGFIIGTLLEREIWILDEITSALDKVSKRTLVDYVMNSDKTVIVISHDDVWLEYDNLKVKEW